MILGTGTLLQVLVGPQTLNPKPSTLLQLLGPRARTDAEVYKAPVGVSRAIGSQGPGPCKEGLGFRALGFQGIGLTVSGFRSCRVQGYRVRLGLWSADLGCFGLIEFFLGPIFGLPLVVCRNMMSSKMDEL